MSICVLFIGIHGLIHFLITNFNLMCLSIEIYGLIYLLITNFNVMANN
jgi:hypothetical protein